jgi:hypothetical protein
MLYHWLANLVVLIHLGFVLFVIAGALLVMRRPRLASLHLPAALWGVLIEFAGWVCPLTPLENHLRLLAGDEGYQGGFIDHYITMLIYPPGLSRTVQVLLGIVVLVVNLGCYRAIIRRLRQGRSATASPRMTPEKH